MHRGGPGHMTTIYERCSIGFVSLSLEWVDPFRSAGSSDLKRGTFRVGLDKCLKRLDCARFSV